LKILLVSATYPEIKGLVDEPLRVGEPHPLKHPAHYIDALVTGIGAVPTAFHIAQLASRYQLVVSIGIAGAYNSHLSIGDVVIVGSDVFGDYGIDDNGRFIPLQKSGLLITPMDIINDDIMLNPWVDKGLNPLSLRRVRGVTLGTASGSPSVISAISQRWDPDVETMESAAVFYSCLLIGKPFACIRSISNRVEPRNRAKWRIEEAVNNLQVTTQMYLNALNMQRSRE
jgi:futalosine hydrolase